MGTKRKYVAEGALHLYSSPPGLFRPCDVYEQTTRPELRAAFEHTNVYVIGRRRRISVHPKLRVFAGQICGDFRLHDEDLAGYERYPFTMQLPMTNGEPLPLVSASTSDAAGSVVVAHLANGTPITFQSFQLPIVCEHRLERHVDLEVLYVGKAYGKDGTRVAADRLKTHDTLQRILADTAAHRPADEILIVSFRFGHYKKMLSNEGDFSIDSTATSEEDIAYIKHVNEVRFDRKDRIALAEAALIAHFKPAYNTQLKETFSRRAEIHRRYRVKFLESVLRRDLSGLIVEAGTPSLGLRLYSNSVPRKFTSDVYSSDAIARMNDLSWLREKGLDPVAVRYEAMELTHTVFAKFPLYSSEERESFLHTQNF
jgi:hypothetical protein